VPAPLPRARRDTIRRRLIAWYRRARRDLPWRRTDDPYRIWLSEAMLQQTRVETVIPYYERFLARFPSVEALAAADEEDVLRLWAGLGYYARARNLHRAAGLVVKEHGGALPRDPEQLAALPGVGRYTLGALRSLVWKEPAPLVDGNVRRVLARLFADDSSDDAEAWRLAEALVPERDPDLFNQALMELGATVCTPRNPACPSCPVRLVCEVRKSGGDAEAFPAKRRRAAVREVRALAGFFARRGRVLLLRRPSRGLLGGLWELPNVEGRDPDALVAHVRARTGLESAPGAALGGLRHGFTHRALELDVLSLEDRGGRLGAAVRDEARLCTPGEVGDLPLSRLMKKALALARR
jgi:A/G-specific adenine glycosylase